MDWQLVGIVLVWTGGLAVLWHPATRVPLRVVIRVINILISPVVLVLYLHLHAVDFFTTTQKIAVIVALVAGVEHVGAAVVAADVVEGGSIYQLVGVGLRAGQERTEASGAIRVAGHGLVDRR